MYDLLLLFHAHHAAAADAARRGHTHRTPPAAPSLAVRARTALRRRSLDAAIAGGADPESSDLLTLRAEQLAARRTREQTADALCQVVMLSEHAARRTAATAPFQRQSVRAAQDELLALAEALRTARRAAPRGVALARCLLGDGTGALYARGEAGAVRAAAEAARAALA